MLTSHYLLGGFLAVSCAIGALIHAPGSTDSSTLILLKNTLNSDAVDVSYRGSGRLDNMRTPSKPKHSASIESTSHSTQAVGGKDLVAHRGSGRIRPSLL